MNILSIVIWLCGYGHYFTLFINKHSVTVYKNFYLHQLCTHRSQVQTLANKCEFPPSQYGDWIIPVQHSQYHDCWCPGSLCHQDMSIHDIDYVEEVRSCLTWERNSTTCVMSVWRKYINCRCMFMFLMNNLAHVSKLVHPSIWFC